MIPELGHFSLALALVIAIVLASVPLAGTILNRQSLMAYARPMATGQFVFVLISFLCLTYAFVVDDFTVQYVAGHSNSLLPVHYKVSAVWGGHEGSLLLWMLILAGWTWAVALFSRQLPIDMLARVLSVMGMIGVGFLLFILATSNPFNRYLPQSPTDGADLNPLLQDFGLIVHPPMLYMGYVGFSVAFAFAIAALLSGRLDSAWARWSRPWTTIAWAFLTLGIALGSWWAYYELGWGGWWFWDPVENASFMPWLVGTALMHSLAVTEKRGMFKSWTVLLAIVAFSLSLLGTFLVRSGVLTSVHAFATDPTRGAFVLMLLGITILGSLTLYAIRVPAVHSRAKHGLFSRETFLLLNNVLLIAATAAVLFGTLYPLWLDFIGGGKISVGAPYFNTLFVPLVMVLVLVMGVGQFSLWKDTAPEKLVKPVIAPFIVSGVVAMSVALFYGDQFELLVLFGIFIAGWLCSTMFVDVWYKSSHSNGRLYGFRRLSRSYLGMVTAHIGLAVTIVGATMVSNFNEERDLRMGPGDTAEIGHYHFVLDSIEPVQGPNYTAEQANFTIYKDETRIGTLEPQKRQYLATRSVMTEAGIDPGLFRDVYIAMGEPLQNGDWAIRVQVKPFVRWLWLGALLMAVGGTWAILDRRYRLKVKRKAQSDVKARGASRLVEPAAETR
ncbi:cytochrome c-type biogenesis protein CcmF [Oleiphilus messinensis]|uniref:Cytochrome c-type biogenesis protein CcmF n=1 Tax=Oleiphilus messinensis TaxID=141451 RepID=A0A1Y0ICR0_9GAMM|nr:heme lyase CcmF/NrfE family subunit [Oleiphilus messinensis]ARU57255.1 cytochrome c-type biogenesis protein CcmF [Oleiphilus messinensis]